MLDRVLITNVILVSPLGLLVFTVETGSHCLVIIRRSETIAQASADIHVHCTSVSIVPLLQ